MVKQKILHFYGWALVSIAGLIVIHAPLSVFFGTVFPQLALEIKAWKEIIMVVLALPAAWLMWHSRHTQKWTADRLFWLIVAYILLHFLMLMDWQGVRASLAGLAIDLRYITYFALVYVLVRLSSVWRSRLIKVFSGGAAVVVGFAVVQIVLPHDFLKIIGYSNDTIAPSGTIDKNSAFVRQISTLRGPNPLGAYALGVITMVVAVLGQAKRRLGQYRTIALGFGAMIALYVSFSRSAYLGAAIAVLIVMIVNFGRLKKFWYGVMAMVAIGFVLLAVVMAIHPAYISNVIFHSNPTGGSATKSDEGHANSIAQGVDDLVTQPLGDGVGSSGSASLLGEGTPQIIENQYLMIAHETGWLGVVIFVVIFVVILRRLWRQRANPWALGVFASGIGLAFIGLLLPVWTDDTVSMVWWGLAATIIGGEHGKRSTKQKTARAS